MANGQASTELLVIIGLLLFLLLPLLLYANGRVNVARDDLSVQKAEFAAQRMASLVDSVGYLGGAAAIRDEIEIPSRVKSISVKDGRDIVFDVDSIYGQKQIVKSTEFSIDAAPSLSHLSAEGTHFVKIEAVGTLDGASGKQVRLSVE